MPIRKELLDELIKDCEKPEDMLGQDGLLKRLTGALVERMLEAEMSEHLGYEKHSPNGRGSGNSRNGHGKKTLKTDRGEMEIAVPRDRNSTFEPLIVEKRKTRFEGFDDQIISMYGRGMTQREIRDHLQELYGVEVSIDLISRATDAVWDELKAWRSRPLEAIYPVVILDAVILKVREKGQVRNRSAYVALGVNLEGYKDVLGLWIQGAEGAKFWLMVLTELKNRGVQDILIACCDGLQGFPDAIETVFPETLVQTCIVHMIRNSTRYVNWKERKQLARDLKPIYKAATRADAEIALDQLEAKWGDRYPMAIETWRSKWERIVPYLDFPEPIRKMIYTTNALESLNASLRKVINPRGHFPNDEAAMKILYLAVQNQMKRWQKPRPDWRQIVQHLALYFEGRIPTN